MKRIAVVLAGIILISSNLHASEDFDTIFPMDFSQKRTSIQHPTQPARTSVNAIESFDASEEKSELKIAHNNGKASSEEGPFKFDNSSSDPTPRTSEVDEMVIFLVAPLPIKPNTGMSENDRLIELLHEEPAPLSSEIDKKPTGPIVAHIPQTHEDDKHTSKRFSVKKSGTPLHAEGNKSQHQALANRSPSPTQPIVIHRKKSLKSSREFSSRSGSDAELKVGSPTPASPGRKKWPQPDNDSPRKGSPRGFIESIKILMSPKTPSPRDQEQKK